MYTEIFCCKNVSAKATHIFSAKNIRILYIESAKTVNEMTCNELFFLFFFDLGFTALSRIFHLYRANRSSKVGENRRTWRKTT